MLNRVQKFFMLVGLLKYGIVLSLLLIYLPLTAVFRGAPGHDITGNMFVELPAIGVLLASMFLLAVVWSVMFTEGLIVNSSESRFSDAQATDPNLQQIEQKPSKARRAYRRLQEIQKTPSQHIPVWAGVFFAVPVTGWQFVWFTILLASPSFIVIIWWSGRPILALVMSLLAFMIDYIAFIIICTPAALLDTGDPPLRGFPLAEKIWSWFGYRPGAPAQNTGFFRFSRWLQGGITATVRKFRLLYLVDPSTHLIYPIHFLTIIIASVLCFAGSSSTGLRILARPSTSSPRRSSMFTQACCSSSGCSRLSISI